MSHLKTAIFHGKRAHPTEPSPRLSREHAELWMGYLGAHDDWTRRFDPHPVEHCKHYPDGIKGRRPDVWEYYKSLPSIAPIRWVDNDRVDPEVLAQLEKGEWHSFIPVQSGSEVVSGVVNPHRPVYLLEAHPEVPASLAYPEELARIGRVTCTVDMMFVLALHEGFQHIILHNIGLITDDWETTALNPEWAYKHKGILYWIGAAEGRGVRVTVEGESIFAPPTKVYGFETCGRDFGVEQRRYFTKGRK